MKMKEPGPGWRPSSSISLAKNCLRTRHVRSRNQAQSYRLRLHMKHYSIYHRVAVGRYSSDSYTCYRPPWDPPRSISLLGVRAERLQLTEGSRNLGCHARVVLKQCDVRSQRCAVTSFSHFLQEKRSQRVSGYSFLFSFLQSNV